MEPTHMVTNSSAEFHKIPKRRHINIPIFLPQYGCRHCCVYCSQEKITGTTRLKPDAIANDIQSVLKTADRNNSDIEIAFFGGSFTALPQPEMIAYLETAAAFVRRGEVDSIRLSTRPDAVNEEILDILQTFCVHTIELGIQSMNNHVLEICQRGHTAEDSRRACRTIVRRGFALVGQMMTGLPGASLSDEIRTAEEIADMGASAARIYPTVVFDGTVLGEMTRSGAYLPPSYEESVLRASAALRVLAEAEIPVIRIGLCENESLHTAGGIIAGAYGPSMGEDIRGEVWVFLADKALAALCPSKGSLVTLFVPSRDVSQVTGKGRKNLQRIKNKYALSEVYVRGCGKLPPWKLELAVSYNGSESTAYDSCG